MGLEQRLSDHNPQHRVPQELEPLVVSALPTLIRLAGRLHRQLIGLRAVRQRLNHQLRAHKGMSQSQLEQGQIRGLGLVRRLHLY